MTVSQFLAVSAALLLTAGACMLAATASKPGSTTRVFTTMAMMFLFTEFMVTVVFAVNSFGGR